MKKHLPEKLIIGGRTYSVRLADIDWDTLKRNGFLK